MGQIMMQRAEKVAEKTARVRLTEADASGHFTVAD